MQVYGFCIRTLRLPVISVMIIGVMRLSYNERAVPAVVFATDFSLARTVPHFLSPQKA